MVYYLKLNRNIDYSIHNLQIWIDALSNDDDAEVYILCDNEELNKRIKNEINFRCINPNFIKSIKREEHKEIMDMIAVPRWYNAGYAHLTPFIHAKNCGYLYYWNIDADDTMFALRPQRIYEAIIKAKEYAINHDIDLFSLDMWRSRSKSMHWSFGITFTNGAVNWLEVIKEFSQYESGSVYFTNWNHPKNIDEFFTYIKSKDKNHKIETFYFENLLFLHYSDDFIMNPITSSVYKWKNNELHFPIIENVYGIESLGRVNIAEDVVQLDITITDEECGFALASYAPFSSEMTNIVEADEFEAKRTKEIQYRICEKVKAFSKKTDRNQKIYIFGFGKYTGFIINILRENHVNVVSVLDNAKVKWGGVIEGLMITSPDVLQDEDKSKVIVLIDVRFYDQIRLQLVNMGVSTTNIYKIIDYSLQE